MSASDLHATAVTRDDDVYVATNRTPAAQRQWAYRQRRKSAMIDAIGNETAASRSTLLALLAHELLTLEGGATSANMAGPARNTARRVLNEIITRYAIEL